MRIGLATVLGFMLAGCSGANDESSIKTVQQKLVWSCLSYQVTLGSSLECTASSDGIATSSDGVSATGGTSATEGYAANSVSTGGFGSSTGTYGVTGGTSATATGTATGGTSTSGSPGADTVSGGSGGSTASGSTATSMDGVSYGTIPGEYTCQAGTSWCPPIDARPGATFIVNAGGGFGSGAGGADSIGGGTSSGLPGAGSATSGSGGAGASSEGERDGDGEKAGGEKGDKDDAKAESSSTGSGGGGAKGGGSGGSISSSDGVSITYHCVFDGKKRSCKQAIPTCESGSIPVPGNQCGTPSPGAGTVISGPGETVTTTNKKSVSFQGCVANNDGTTTCTYQVSELDGGQDLSNWVLGTNCAVVSGSPSSGFEYVHPDPNAGITGVKWNTGGGFSSGSFSVTVKGSVSLGVVSFGTKAPGVALGQISGPVCR